MAEGDDDRPRQIRKIQELFHGRFTEFEIRIVLEAKNWNPDEAVDYIFSSESSDIRRLIDAHGGSFQDLEARFQDGLALAEQWSVVGPDRRHINKTSRQFACPKCDWSWWKKVPKRKMVAKCFRCKKKYDALPREKEWGWAEFHCECGKVFGGFCQRITSSPCHVCNSNVFPCRIIPPRHSGDRGASGRTIDTHHCNAPDCVYKNNWSNQGGRGRRRGRQGAYNLGIFPDGINGVQTCVHPRNLGAANKRRAVVPSPEHVSSGSTIDTCLTQDDLLDMVSVIHDLGSYRETGGMPPIPEESRGDGNMNGNSSSSGST